ncbi:hypothetical protein AAMO2058_000028800 [Amorphochlora amoebiformis]
MLTGIDLAKQKAAHAAVDETVETGMRIGVGSGSTVVFAIERLKQRVEKGDLKDILCVPTSFQSSILLKEANLPRSDPNDNPVLDVAIDGADEVDMKLNCIKGGGACQLQEKIVAACAKKFVVIADYRKESKVLGEKWKKGVPIAVVPLGYSLVELRIKEMGGKPVLRMAKNKAGPVVSDNGNFIIDADFGLIKDPSNLNTKLQLIPGVVEVGLFCGMACKAFFGQKDGTFTTRVLS